MTRSESPAPPPELTVLLRAWSQGQAQAGERALALVYDELHRRAGAFMRRERRDHTLQATALVHEAFLRLAEQGQVEWQDRNHFFSIASVTMRRILVEHARAHVAAKRGGSWCRVPLDDRAGAAVARDVDLLDLDAALTELAREDERCARLVELRFFGGLPIDQAAEALSLSPATAKRDWALARAWLFDRLGGTGRS